MMISKIFGAKRNISFSKSFCKNTHESVFKVGREKNFKSINSNGTFSLSSSSSPLFKFHNTQNHREFFSSPLFKSTHKNESNSNAESTLKSKIESTVEQGSQKEGNGEKKTFMDNAAVKAYNAHLEKHPLMNKVLTFCVLMAAGDIVAQLTNDEEDFDWKRFGRMVGLAAVFSAPILHIYFKFLDKAVVGTGSAQVLKKLAIDQFAFAPINLLGFMALLGYLEKFDFEAVKEKIAKDYWPTLKANWVLWPAANFINFKLVPPHYRLLYVSVVAFFWNIYFSILANKK
eukprot:TRINITY_DN2381_c0_g2_i1.p1 TRINITY_DN2381_c0_g2~~TRINITY_DN2381_c0_g2_i1.p1  ORF type:complete len:287 (+),score=101.13 TRINITY_DN2381_c0_g2_i1:185-1045(+)